VCAIAAGVREFRRALDDPDGVFGVAQWFPGRGHDLALGPAEDEFVSGCADRTGSVPDDPAVQAVAAAVIASHWVRWPVVPAVMTFGQLRPSWKHRPCSAASGSTLNAVPRLRIRPSWAVDGGELRLVTDRRSDDSQIGSQRPRIGGDCPELNGGAERLLAGRFSAGWTSL
jgi:hypothetical protein